MYFFRDYEERKNLYSDYLDQIKLLKEENNQMKGRIDELLWYEKQYDRLKDKLYECELTVKSLKEENQNLRNNIKEIEEQNRSNREESQEKSEKESVGKEV